MSLHMSHKACRIVPVEAESLAVEEVEEGEEVEDKGTRIRDSIIGRIGEIKATQPPRFRIRTRINHALPIGRTHTPRLRILTINNPSTSRTRINRTTPAKHLGSPISPAQLILTCRHEMSLAARDHPPRRQVTIQLDATKAVDGRSVDRSGSWRDSNPACR